MLRVILGESELSVAFSHTYIENQITRISSRCTICTISGGEVNSLDKDKIVMSEKVAITHPKDNFSKSVGRKVALAKCLKDMTEKEWIDKEDRATIWEKYFALCGVR